MGGFFCRSPYASRSVVRNFVRTDFRWLRYVTDQQASEMPIVGSSFGAFIRNVRACETALGSNRMLYPVGDRRRGASIRQSNSTVLRGYQLERNDLPAFGVAQ